MSFGATFPAVVEAAKAGGEWAWEIIYRELAGQVRGYLRAHGAREPDDLVGEVFLQLARNLHGFEGDEAKFRSWVFVVTHHRLVDERRSSARRPVDVAPAEELDQSHGSVEDEVVGRLTVAEARAMIDRLSPDQRDVLLLRILGGLTVEEVAQAVGKRPGAVKALQRRALAALQRASARDEVPR